MVRNYRTLILAAKGQPNIIKWAYVVVGSKPLHTRNFYTWKACQKHNYLDITPKQHYVTRNRDLVLIPIRAAWLLPVSK